MCGICGIYYADPRRTADRATLERMTDSMTHRGPDAAGYYYDGRLALGHRRLKIIDLTEAANQPMGNADRSRWLVFNGEIYNYRELRMELQARGHHFMTQSDTEVILHAYDAWGERCLERFNGDWAFALWDREQQTLFCARDRFGVKPFYYYADDQVFVFASEIKAVLAYGLTPRLDTAWARNYLAHGWVDRDSSTAYAGISRLPAAHRLHLNELPPRPRRYWQIPVDTPAGDDPVRCFRECFIDAVRLRLRSDVAIKTCLSGGLDSTAVVSAVRHLCPETGGGKYKAFYAQADGDPDRPYA
ncbi:MAG TPA: asparagine synthase (glutamine-hydrolyzing), partial [bacterium]|nr:asparagine synthase (glutamine-hydrolyzing) [bacterium]